MIYRVRHVTTMRYAAPVRLARLNVRLKPAPWRGQVLLDHALDVIPAPALREEDTGPFLVHRTRLRFAQPLSRLTLESRLHVEVCAPSFHLETAVAPTIAQVREEALASTDLSPLGPAGYLFTSPVAAIHPEIAAWAASCLAPRRSVAEAGQALMRAIHTQFRYDDRATSADTQPIDAFRARHGVCQDFAHVMIIAARAHGIPAAYVSGYLRTLPPPGAPRLVGADAMHAWVALWCGAALGWIGFDPTNAIVAGSDHIFVAMGRDYADVAPLDGVFLGGAGQSMTYSVDVEPVA